MEDPELSEFCCQNERCVAYGSYGAKNLSVCDRIGKRRHIRLLYCRVCRTRFSERKGTVFYRSHTPVPKVVSILAHVQEGCGMRATGRLVGVKEDTVIRYAKLAGRHAAQSHARLVALSPSHARGAAGREVGVRRAQAAALRRRGSV